ncbi:phytoene synthase [Rhizobium albus]|nr:phytoene synthase [Rhizobium albus]
MDREADGTLTQHEAYCLAELRELDRDRYLACLLSPASVRGALASLYLFNAEIARVRDLVREPLAGEVRLQWWRDVITGSGTSTAAGHPGAEALLATIDRHRLPRDAFDRFIEARLFDLYDDPMPDRAAFEAYAGETAATVIQLAAVILGGERATSAAEAAGHAGVAQAVAGTLLLLPIHHARGQLLVPGDILSACGTDAESFLGERHHEGSVIAALVAYGRDHLARARNAAKRMDRDLFAAFLPIALVAPILDRAARSGQTIEDLSRIQPPQWRRQLRLLRAASTSRF